MPSISPAAGRPGPGGQIPAAAGIPLAVAGGSDPPFGLAGTPPSWFVRWRENPRLTLTNPLDMVTTMDSGTTTLTLTAGRASEPGPTTDRDGTVMPGPTADRDASTTPASTTDRDTSTTPAPTTDRDASTTPVPTTDRDTPAIPERIAEILDIVLILAEYGRHLLGTIEQRAVWSTFSTIAQFFGTNALAAILPRIQRGIMRAVALERVLRARAARGRDLNSRLPQPAMPRAPKPSAMPALADLATSIGMAIVEHSPTAGAPAAQSARPRRRREEAPLTFNNMPNMAAVMAEVRRRPVGKTIVDILCDLGIAFTLCSGSFGSRLFKAIHYNQGSLGRLMDEMRRREKQFDDLRDRNPHLPAPARGREATRAAVGFFVGDPVVNPCDPPEASNAPDQAAMAAQAVGAVPAATSHASGAIAATGPP